MKTVKVIPVSAGGVSMTTGIFIVFLILKLTGTIDWSWLYVTMPLWLIPAVFFGVFGLIFLVWLMIYSGLWFWGKITN